jgi:sphingomyelin phosphodiesterase acid-like 3
VYSAFPSPFSSLCSAHSLLKSPDFILFNGDMAGHGLPDQTAVLSAMQTVSQHIEESFPSTTVFPTIGNDDLPSDYELPTFDHTWLESLWGLWKKWIGGDPSIEKDFKYGGYYAASIPSNTRLIVLNTIYYSTRYKNATTEIPLLSNRLGLGEEDPSDPAGQFAWLTGQLNDARENGTPVIIMGHIPPGGSVYGGSDNWKAEYVSTFFNTIRPFANLITAQLYGHFHSDTFKLFMGPGEDPISFGLVSPSISPIFSNNPGFRIFDYDQQSGMINDFRQYYADVFTANTLGSMEWNEQYTFTEKWGEKFVDLDAMKEMAHMLATSPKALADFLAQTMMLYSPNAYMQICSIFHASDECFDTCVRSGSESGWLGIPPCT